MEIVKSFKPCERGVPAVAAAGGWRLAATAGWRWLLMVLDVLGVEEGRWRRKKERKKERWKMRSMGLGIFINFFYFFLSPFLNSIS